jgi:hypothetical protein
MGDAKTRFSIFRCEQPKLGISPFVITVRITFTQLRRLVFCLEQTLSKKTYRQLRVLACLAAANASPSSIILLRLDA